MFHGRQGQSNESARCEFYALSKEHNAFPIFHSGYGRFLEREMQTPSSKQLSPSQQRIHGICDVQERHGHSFLLIPARRCIPWTGDQQPTRHWTDLVISTRRKYDLGQDLTRLVKFSRPESVSIRDAQTRRNSLDHYYLGGITDWKSHHHKTHQLRPSKGMVVVVFCGHGSVVRDCLMKLQ